MDAQRRRGAVLTVVLLFGMFGTGLGAYQGLFNEAHNRRLAIELAAQGYSVSVDLPGWYYSYSGFMSLAIFVCYFAIWDYLKPGVFALVALEIVGLIVSGVAGISLGWMVVPGVAFKLLVAGLTIRIWSQMRWLPARGE